MKHALTSIAILCLVAGIALVACTNDASDARESSNTETSAGTSEVTESASPSAQVFEALRAEIAELQMTATTQQKLVQVLEEIAGKLESFLQEYPDSKESLDAKIELGMVYTSLMKHDLAIKYFSEFIEESGEEDDQRTGYAQFYLARAYESADKYDEAKRHYKIFVEKYGYLNPKFLATAQATLADISVLKQLAVGKEPIPFSVEDLTGKTISLADFKGKVVLLDFWATWCMPCKVEMPNVIRIHKKYNEKGFEIIGISLDNNKIALEQYIKTSGMTWPQHFDGRGWQNGVAQKYRVRQIPTTYLIDRQGKIRYRSLRGKELEDAVAKLINET